MNDIGDFHTDYTDVTNIFQSSQNPSHPFYGVNQAGNRTLGQGEQLATGEYDDVLDGPHTAASQDAPILMPQPILQSTIYG